MSQVKVETQTKTVMKPVTVTEKVVNITLSEYEAGVFLDLIHMCISGLPQGPRGIFSGRDDSIYNQLIREKVKRVICKHSGVVTFSDDNPNLPGKES